MGMYLTLIQTPSEYVKLDPYSVAFENVLHKTLGCCLMSKEKNPLSLLFFVFKLRVKIIVMEHRNSKILMNPYEYLLE